MITGMEINLGEDSGSVHLIKQIFNLGERVFILDGHIIESSVVHAQANGTVPFVHKYHG